MLITASTVKDSLPAVRRFVSGNLAGGVDHMVIFLDSLEPTDADVEAFLRSHDHVTCVRTDREWWGDERPEELNVRQRINANIAKAILCAGDWASWIFHIDVDEIVQIDRSVLDSVPPRAQVVRLAPLEAVSLKRWEDEPTWFKRLLGKDDLTLLQVLGIIDRPHNGAYFHGHVDGKSGIRPTLDRWLTLHHGVDGSGTEIEPWSHESLRVLHYESFSGEEFVRKWTSLLAAGPRPNFRPARQPTAVALAALLAKGLTAEEAQPYLMRIFERTTEDDFVSLRTLRLLEYVDPRAGSHVPAALTPREGDELVSLFAVVAKSPKRIFHPGEPAERVADVLGLRPARRLFRKG